jgi:hypothetical protein
MRVLAVVDGELTGADERDERALLEALVAANGPDRPEVHVMVLVHGARPVIVVGNPPYPPIAVMSGQDRAGASGVNPAESARQRLAVPWPTWADLVCGRAVTSSQARPVALYAGRPPQADTDGSFS